MNERERLQAEELDAYLTSLQSGRHPSRPEAVPVEQVALLEGLHALARASDPDLDFVLRLEGRLRAVARARLVAESSTQARETRPPQDIRSGAGPGGREMNKRILLFAASALALVVLLATAFVVLNRSGLRPDQGGLARATVTPAAGAQDDLTSTPATPPPTGDQQGVVEAPTLTPIPGPDGPPLLPPLAAVIEGGHGGGGGVGAIPANAVFILGTTLPEEPAQVPAVVQREPALLTLETVRQMAQRLGLDPLVYTPRPDAGEGEPPMLVAVDEPLRAWFQGSWLRYEDRDRPDYGYPPEGVPPLEQATQVATRFLEAAGLLETPYQVISSQDTVMFFHTLGSGWTLSEPFAEVSFSPDGQVRSVSYQGLDLAEVGSYSVISAQDAWEILQSEASSGRVWYEPYRRTDLPAWDDWSQWIRHNPRVWSRQVVAGQRAHLFGGIQILYPAEPGLPLHLTMGGLILVGDLQPLAEGYQALVESTGTVDVPVHVWGEVQDAGGYLTLQVEGWQAEGWEEGALSLPYLWTGTIQRQDGQGMLLTDDGRTIPISDLPSALDDGTPVFVTGGQVDGTLEWSSIQESPTDESVPAEPWTAPPSQIQAVVEQVELIYLIPAADYAPAEFDWGYRAPQPVWRFSGHTDQGTAFTVFVQAVSGVHLGSAPASSE